MTKVALLVAFALSAAALVAETAHADVATPEQEQCFEKREGDLCGFFDTCQNICRQSNGEGEGEPPDCGELATDACDDVPGCFTQLQCGGAAGCSDAGPPRRRPWAMAGIAAALALGVALGRKRR